jgi:hypothetical protein
MATCGGGHLLQILTPLDPAPVWGIIGPTNDVTTGNVAEGFRAFYEVFLRGGDGIEATRALNRASSMRDWNYRFYSAELIFQEVFRLYRAQAGDPVNRKDRVDRIVANIRRSRPVEPAEEKALRHFFDQQISEPRLAFEERKRVYFMLDRFPDNAARFPVTYEDCAPKSRKAPRS